MAEHPGGGEAPPPGGRPERSVPGSRDTPLRPPGAMSTRGASGKSRDGSQSPRDRNAGAPRLWGGFLTGNGYPRRMDRGRLATAIGISLVLLGSIAVVPSAGAVRPAGVTIPYTLDSVIVPAGPFFEDFLDCPGGTTEHASGCGEWGVSGYDSSEFTILDGATHAIVRNTVVGAGPIGVEADDQTQAFWIADSEANNVSVVNAAGRLIHTLHAGTMPIRDCYDREDSRYFVMNYGSDNISVFNSSSYAHAGTITTWTGSPFGCSFNDAADELWVAVDGTNEVSVYRGSTLAFLGNATNHFAETNLATIAGDSSGSNMYVTDFGSDTVTVFGLLNRTAWKQVVTCASPYGAGDDYGAGEVYVACWGDSKVAVISESNASLLTVISLPTGATPYGLHGYDPNNGEMMVSDNGISQVTFIADGTGGCLNTTAGCHGPAPLGPGSGVVTVGIVIAFAIAAPVVTVLIVRYGTRRGGEPL